MNDGYAGVVTRFLRKDERFMLSKEHDMPLVIEARDRADVSFLQTFLASYSVKLLEDLSTYGAVLLRGFDIASEEDFEKTVLSIKGFRGISEAFMSEEGRTHVGDLNYVLHTNAVYKTGGTLYLGGFHGENYYSPDVPTYICFCCLKPSLSGGETGLINMEKIYQFLNDALREKLEKKAFFVTKWLVSEVAKRYQVSPAEIENICHRFDLPLVGEGSDAFILMYKPSVFEHPFTKKPALQVNLFELPTLNAALRQCFLADYQGKTWFWHRVVWKIPNAIFKIIEFFSVMFISFFHSPKEALGILRTKWKVYHASKRLQKLLSWDEVKVGSCFNEEEVNELAHAMRDYYSSCLWEKGDILLVDNRKVMHAGMPGAGPRVVRAIIGNPLEMSYSYSKPGLIDCTSRTTETIGASLFSARTSRMEQAVVEEE